MKYSWTISILAGIILTGGFLALNTEPTQDALVGGAPVLSIEEKLAQEIPRFAQIDPNTGEVLQVILIDQANIDTGKWGNPKNWIRTSERGTIRKNHAGKGFIYDKNRDAFIPPKPNGSTVFDEQKARWVNTDMPSATFVNSTSTDI